MEFGYKTNKFKDKMKIFQVIYKHSGRGTFRALSKYHMDSRLHMTYRNRPSPTRRLKLIAYINS